MIEQSRLTLNGGVHVVLDEVIDSQRSLFDVVMEYDRGLLVKPDHQRDFVWEGPKVKAWIDRIALATTDRARKPVGAIVTYQIDDGFPSPRFVNDGSQRIRATLAVLHSPSEFGYDRDQVEAILRATTIPVQHRLYKNQDDALEDFQLLNMGTSLTPREMCKGILSNHPSYKPSWQPLLTNIHMAMSNLPGGLIQKLDMNNRRQQHKFERHDFSLVVRWFGDGSLTDSRNVSSSELRKDQIDAKQVIETELRQTLQGRNSEDLRREIAMIVGHIERQVALYRVLWDELRPDLGRALSPTLFRWLVDISIWARINNIAATEWEVFVRMLLSHTKGTSIVQAPDDIRTRVTLALGSVGKLKSVCRIIGSDLYVGKAARKKTRVPILPGFDESHINPFITNGNGPTIPEPASRNRSRGAKGI